ETRDEVTVAQPQLARLARGPYRQQAFVDRASLRDGCDEIPFHAVRQGGLFPRFPPLKNIMIAAEVDADFFRGHDARGKLCDANEPVKFAVSGCPAGRRR